MPCGDIPGRVHVSIVGVSAGHAAEQGLALAAARCGVPARRAALARVRADITRTHLDDAEPLVPPGFAPRRAAGVLAKKPVIAWPWSRIACCSTHRFHTNRASAQCFRRTASCAGDG